MRTRPVLAGLALILVLASAACSDGSGDDASATTPVSPASPASASTSSTATSITSTPAPVDSGDLPLPPLGTGDLPLPPLGTGDLPPMPPVSSDVPYVVNVTVGLDADPTRIERVPLGVTITLNVTNPAARDEFHLHGYDLGDDQVMPAGQTASFTFVANQVGSFELESHATEDVLLVLEVV